MSHRFFILLYFLTLVAIAASLPIYLLKTVNFNEIFLSSYKTKCLNNGQYVVLQGTVIDEEHWIIGERELNDRTLKYKERLNFYCQHYDQIRLHIIAYRGSKTESERMAANIAFSKFEESVMSNVYAYPQTYELELVSEEKNYPEITFPLINWLMRAFLIFVFLQVLRICYVYIKFGEIVWHPFKAHKN